MSQGIYPVRCPRGHEFSASLHDSLNVTQEPELRDQLFDGKINVVKCQECGVSFHLERPILYHDAARRILVWCYPEVEPERRKVLLEEHRNLISRQFALLPASLRPRKVRFVFGGLDLLLEVVQMLEKEPADSVSTN